LPVTPYSNEASAAPISRAAALRRSVISIRSVLYALPSKTVVHPGHGPRTTIEEEMLLNPFVPAAF